MGNQTAKRVTLINMLLMLLLILDKLEAQEKESVRVDVYYECLCPDSRY